MEVLFDGGIQTVTLLAACPVKCLVCFSSRRKQNNASDESTKRTLRQWKKPLHPLRFLMSLNVTFRQACGKKYF